MIKLPNEFGRGAFGNLTATHGCTVPFGEELTPPMDVVLCLPVECDVVTIIFDGGAEVDESAYKYSTGSHDCGEKI